MHGTVRKTLSPASAVSPEERLARMFRRVVRIICGSRLANYTWLGRVACVPRLYERLSRHEPIDDRERQRVLRVMGLPPGVLDGRYNIFGLPRNGGLLAPPLLDGGSAELAARLHRLLGMGTPGMAAGIVEGLAELSSGELTVLQAGEVFAGRQSISLLCLKRIMAAYARAGAEPSVDLFVMCADRWMPPSGIRFDPARASSCSHVDIRLPGQDGPAALFADDVPPDEVVEAVEDSAPVAAPRVLPDISLPPVPPPVPPPPAPVWELPPAVAGALLEEHTGVLKQAVVDKRLVYTLWRGKVYICDPRVFANWRLLLEGRLDGLSNNKLGALAGRLVLLSSGQMLVHRALKMERIDLGLLAAVMTVAGWTLDDLLAEVEPALQALPEEAVPEPVSLPVPPAPEVVPPVPLPVAAPRQGGMTEQERRQLAYLADRLRQLPKARRQACLRAVFAVLAKQGDDLWPVLLADAMEALPENQRKHVLDVLVGNMYG